MPCSWMDGGARVPVNREHFDAITRQEDGSRQTNQAAANNKNGDIFTVPRKLCHEPHCKNRRIQLASGLYKLTS